MCNGSLLPAFFRSDVIALNEAVRETETLTRNKEHGLQQMSDLVRKGYVNYYKSKRSEWGRTGIKTYSDPSFILYPFNDASEMSEVTSDDVPSTCLHYGLASMSKRKGILNAYHVL